MTARYLLSWRTRLLDVMVYFDLKYNWNILFCSKMERRLTVDSKWLRKCSKKRHRRKMRVTDRDTNSKNVKSAINKKNKKRTVRIWIDITVKCFLSRITLKCHFWTLMSAQEAQRLQKCRTYWPRDESKETGKMSTWHIWSWKQIMRVWGDVWTLIFCT